MKELNPTFEKLTLETILNHIQVKKLELGKERENGLLFQIKTGNEWIEQAKKRPVPKMLFSELWHENELCILFADTNLGKSILAVQIANSISNGIPINGFKLEAKKQKVLYFDFELSDKQFENRYSEDFTNHYEWNSNFLRVEINPDAIIPESISFEDYLNESLENSIKETDSKILIIDNLTYLKNETEKAKDALPLMKHLKTLKSRYNLSILALAHTPKRDLSKPLTRNDLSGSKMLINFVDSCFAIGESHTDKYLRYIKQIKERHTDKIYDGENVICCQVNKPSNFLQFEFIGFGNEQEHLKELTEKDKEKRISEAFELKKQGLSNVDIAKKFNVTEGAIRKWLKKIPNNE